MSWIIVGTIIAGGLVLSALFSGSEIGLYRVNRLRLHLAVQEGDRRAQSVAAFVADEQEALATLLIGNNVVNYITTAAVAYLFTELLRLGEWDAQVYTIVLVTPAVFVFGEVVPKSLFHRGADRLMRRVAWILSASRAVLHYTGAVWFVKRFTGLANKVMGQSITDRRATAPKRRVAALLQEALAGEAHGEWQADVIDRVVELSETPLRAVMIPRRRVAVLSDEAERAELIRIARETGYARLPVVSPRDLQPVGMVKIDNLLRRDDWRCVGECLEPALTIESTETVIPAITRMRQERREAAVVTAAGRMVGLVTLRDLLQEIVGEAGPAA